MSDNNERIEKLLALILINQMGSASQGKKAALLNRAGFSNIEIANILETSTGAIAVRLSEQKKATKKSK